MSIVVLMALGVALQPEPGPSPTNAVREISDFVASRDAITSIVPLRATTDASGRIISMRLSTRLENVASSEALVSYALAVVETGLVGARLHNSDWLLVPRVVHHHSSQKLTVFFDQQIDGVEVYGGQVRATFFSESGGLPASADDEFSNLPDDLVIRRVAGVTWPDYQKSIDLADMAAVREAACADYFSEDVCDTLILAPVVLPSENRLAWRIQSNTTGNLAMLANEFPFELLEGGLAWNNRFLTANTRHFDVDENNDDTLVVHNQSTWIEEIGSGSSCAIILGIPGAGFGVNRVYDGNSVRLGAYGACPVPTPNWVYCSGANCLGSSYFRQQTTYAWVKKARDFAKVGAYSKVAPASSSNISTRMDVQSYYCNSSGACYNGITKTVYLRGVPENNGSTNQYEPSTISHEYGHHFQNSYTSSSNYFCVPRSIREAVAGVFGVLTLKDENPNVFYQYSNDEVSGGRFHHNGATLKVQQAPVVCDSVDVYNFGDAFKQAWYEIANDLNCNADPSECGPTSTGGSFNGSTASGIGWSDEDDARREILEAMAGAFISEGVESSFQAFSDAMVSELEDLGHSSAFIDNVESVLGHHGL